DYIRDALVGLRAAEWMIAIRTRYQTDSRSYPTDLDRVLRQTMPESASSMEMLPSQPVSRAPAVCHYLADRVPLRDRLRKRRATMTKIDRVHRLRRGYPAAAAIFLSMLCDSANAQPRDIRIESIQPHRQIALVIGNAAYGNIGQLKNPVHDADAVAQQLRQSKFDVILFKDAGRRSMGEKIDEFIGRLGSGDVALFYYAGHGVQVDNENYL